MNKRHILTMTLLLTALLVAGNAAAGVVVKGSVYGGGNMADVQANTTVNMGGGQVEGNVYGGGNLGDVGTIFKDARDNNNNLTYNYVWRNSGANGNVNDTEHNNTAGNNTIAVTNTNTGVCTVNISGGTIGTAGNQNTDPTNVENGNVFGGGKGNDNPKFYCEEGMAFATSVTISGGTTVHGCVFGGGEIGRVEDDTKVTISGTSNDGIKGNVFGAGKGLKTHGYSALVRGNTEVTIEGNAKIGHSVFGGGETASLGRFNVVGGSPTTPAGGGGCTVIIQGSSQIGGDVFGAGQGITPETYTYEDKDHMPYRMMAKSMGSFTAANSDYWDNVDANNVWEYFPTPVIYHDFLRTLALASTPTVTIGGGTVTGSVFGGGQRGITLGNVNVNMTGGTVNENVYGGGALADTNTGNWSLNNYEEADAENLNTGELITDLFTRTGEGTTEKPYSYKRYINSTLSLAPYYRRVPIWANASNKSSVYKTNVSLTGGKILGDAYGGGLGQKARAAEGNLPALEDIEALVYGDVKVELNGKTTNGTLTEVASNAKGCIVSRLFGCNNLNGTPKGHVQVYVYGTQKDGAANIVTKNPIHPGLEEEGAATTYDVAAVYGGGNLAPYIPVDALLDYTVSENKAAVEAARTEVYIYGCDRTSIKQVYAGGNAASVSGSFVQVNSVYEIEEVFGGGNGADPYYVNEKKYLNPGANVGYYNYTHFGDSGKGTGTDQDPYQPVDNTDALNKPDRLDNYRYGSGIARTEIRGGKIHVVYGGSNKKGNISTTAVSMYESSNACTMSVDQTYGGGKDAPIDGEVVMELACASGIEEIFGGAKNADIDSDVNLIVTNGSSLKRVFGGNNTSGAINGSITVTIKEGGCEPIRIDELYLGGYLAPYSVYGYKQTNGVYDYIETTDEEGNTIHERIPLKAGESGALSTPRNDPRIFVVSATHIGNIFGGGYKAKLVGNPHINVNMEPGKILARYVVDTQENPFVGSHEDADHNVIYVGKEIEEGTGDGILEIGTIGNIYGGGNMADIIGDTYVEIGTGTMHNEAGIVEDITPARNVAHITGNVYGGGNLGDIGYLDDDTKENDPNSVYHDTHVIICAKEMTENNETVWKSVSAGTEGVTIGGNVYGGGMGEASSFKCEKAMVVGNTNVIIGNGTIGTLEGAEGSQTLKAGTGNVYGGGQIARVERSSEVTIGLAPSEEGGTSAPVILNDVFGAGAGIKTHGYSALVRRNSTVTVQGNAKVKHNVYGGGEIASVGRFKVKNATNASEAPSWLPMGMPFALISGGVSTVTVRGNAVIGPDAAMTMPDFKGHVFGAGKGITPGAFSYADKKNKPMRMMAYDSTNPNYQTGEGTNWDYVSETDHANVWEYFKDEAAYFQFLETLAMSDKTVVTIGNNAQGATDKPFVKGSVYGGSENGHVRTDAYVKVQSGQIGCATGMNAAYADNVFIDPASTAIESSLATCPSWTYTDNGYTYDKFADASGNYSYTGDNAAYAVIPEGERLTSSEGGRPTATDGHTFYGNVFGGGSGYFPFAPGKWYRGAGSVGGDTRVDIEGGHVLSSVYGGNEQTDVGTYRTSATTMPESGGKCIVNIMGGTVGVPRTKTDIQAHPVIGNVFGAGKGDKRVLFNTWTNVWGSRVNVSGGIVYGSVYGGGEDGHVLGNDSVYVTQASGKTITIGSTGESGVDGNVFGGGRGSETALTAGVVGGNVLLEVNSGTILGSVYGGGRLASVGTNFVNPTIANPDHEGEVIPNPDYGTMQTPEADHGNITVTINGGTIGTNNVNSTGIGGNIYGGSKGATANFRLGIVRSTAINMTGGTAYASVYGGGELAQVIGSHTTGSKALGTEIKISGGTIGISGKGTATWGNVYGAGKGNTTDVEAGLVKTNTSVTIQNGSITQGETTTTTTPTIYHNIYGGGAYGSVGTITRGSVDYVIGQTSVADMPTAWEANTGLAEITILGGTIGVDGRENGMIFGSSRGDVGAPGEIHDKLAWVKDTKVTIGASGTDGPTIYGSVYGSGENGHTFHDTDVKVHSGTIGIASGANVVVHDPEEPDNLDKDVTYSAYNYPYRGNVYGGGCGTDTYDVVVDAGTENEKTYKKYNPLAGIVLGDVYVTVDGGQVVHNVYGAGAMGSVGTIDNDLIVKHDTYTDNKESYYNFGLSWPVKFEYKEDADNAVTGKTTVKIEGSAIIGVDQADAKGGHVFGAARGGVDVGQTGIADQRYEEAKLANVRETEVVIGTSSGESTTTTPTIHGSVYGGGEDGHVYEDANIIIHHGTIAHSVFGAGKGESTYMTKLWSAANTPKDTEEAVHSWTAGKVYGNTTVTMNGGSVGYNIYGGGNLASVGKGNYSGGSDDYSTDGYGEHPEDDNAGLWTNTANSDSYLFLNSGIATVNIYGGKVGTDSATDTEDGNATGFPRGNVFGSSRGVAAPSGSESPRYRYKPDFFLGYVNKTVVNIGDAEKVNDNNYTGPYVYGSVYGGGQDGHIRNSALVTVNKGYIGRSGDSNIERGNVFGAGSGTGKYDSDGNGEKDACNYSSGSVSCTTQVDIVGGTIYRNVYGGGALASVGPPFTGAQFIKSKAYDEVKTAATSEDKQSVSYSLVNVKGGTISGSVYGASRGPSDALMAEVFGGSDNNHTYDKKKYATVIWSDVYVTGDATINGSVYGGGEKGIVKHATEVNIGIPAVGQTAAIPYTGTIGESVYGGGKEAVVGGNITVNINSGTINKDVYGGGALANTNTNRDFSPYDQGQTDPVDADSKTGAKVTDDETALAITGETNSPTTTVNLLGGTVKGDAYGGGLGRLARSAAAAVYYTQQEADDYNTKHGFSQGDEGYVTTSTIKTPATSAVTAVEATVYGEIKVNLGSSDSEEATHFWITYEEDNQHKSVVKSGRVFGCNNLNGSPQGNVTVEVFRTVNGYDEEGNVIGKTLSDNIDSKTESLHTYEVAAVYGGGNLATYAPYNSTTKTAHVIIRGCDDTSILTVYGGGNAAAVPETKVDVYSCYEIGSLFGGGNGNDRYKNSSGVWTKNPGANVGNSTHTNGRGNATTTIYGGTVHEAYGGSNRRGTIYGDVNITTSKATDENPACPLNVSKIVAAGKNADVEGDLIVIMDCSPSDKIPELYAGADNANVNGNVELTFTSGNYGKVFGGNNAGGVIRGHIILNIEEGDCATPINIDELYLGGNMAAYSQYGYYVDTEDPDYDPDEPVYLPITKEMTDPTDTEHYKAPASGRITTPYGSPQLNIISCTRIGKVFGGGLGETAIIYGDPIVNINMIPGHFTDNEQVGVPKVMSDLELDPTEENSARLGVIETVYGGGNEAPVYGNTTVNIGAATTMLMNTEPTQLGDKGTDYEEITKTNGDKVYEAPVQGAYITGNVYGGGNLADVKGNTYVNVCAYKDDDQATTDVIEYKGVYITGTGYQGVTIKGSVFGGGKGATENAGVTGAFECAKAMVGEVNTNNGSVDTMKESTDRGTRVSIGNGTVEGTVYGGGEIGRVEWNGVVTVGLPVGENETSAPEIKGDVFGGGKGVEQYGYAALMRGNTFVTVQANAKIGKSVYGGGEIASVGKYNIVKPADIDNPTFMAAHPGIEVGMPYSLANQGSGYCNVTVRGNAEIGPDDMKMYHDGDRAADDEGHVFGAGKGVLPYENENDFKCQKSGHNGAKHPGRMGPGNAWDCYDGNEPAYLRFIETQALATHTEVLVDGNAFVKGSVYGGSLSGHLQHDTHVTIAGDCQIGAGFDTSTNKSVAKYTNWPTNTENITESWKECAHWEYDTNNDMPYDPYAKYLYNGEYYYDEEHTNSSNGGSWKATDGHTYYGNVFGGGSGVVPYRPGKWHREAGTVGGNTVVDITGGHILTSVYGGNEHTDVGTYDPNTRALVAGTGKCTINMIGGTVGVPRTKEDIALHPVTCYVFGAGKGDQRTNFNTWTNVAETQVNISGNARIYGSTFGGGEDGHVLGDVETNVGGTVKIGNTNHNYPTIDESNPGVIIGTQGLSGADGNIFGGGRGFSEQALTAGVVCGNVTVNIHNGKMLGSIFGGGRLASVGTYLVAPENGNYGKLQPDVTTQAATTYTAEEAAAYNQENGLSEGDPGYVSERDVKTPAVVDSHGRITINIDGGTIGATDAVTGKLLTSTSSIGDVFGGCKGSGNNKHFGLAKKTIINMSGGTVNGNVYGGGELGYVGEATLNSSNVYEWNEESVGGGLCTVGISGGTVVGNVFGAGKGKADDFECEKALVRTTNVTISGTSTTVGGNVYGGGEIGRVDQDTEVTIGDGANSGAGTENGAASPTISGNVFGAGAGVETHGYSALVRNNATVTVQGNAHVGHNVYGGGMIASVGQYGLDSNFMPETLKGGGDCIVTVKGYSVIGTSGEGHVFGAGMGVNPFDAAHNYIDYTTDSTDKTTKPKRMTKKPDDPNKMPELYTEIAGTNLIWEYYTSQEKYFNFLQTLALGTDTYVTIDGNASVHGSVYGGSESGFVQKETDVKIQGSSKILTVTDTGNNTTTDGNVFGGGKGVAGFDKAGRVRGNATTTISGSSTVNGNVYGGGELGHVGKFTETADGRFVMQTIEDKNGDEIETGLCTVSVTGGKIGPDNNTDKDKGNVFGAGKGKDDTFKCEKAMAMNTSVSVSGGTVNGNVYGGGEIGRVEYDTEVQIGSGDGAGETSSPTISGSVYGAGRGVVTHGCSALVRKDTKVTIEGDAYVGHSVYGGGEIASVGRYGLDDQKMPSILLGRTGYCTVKVQGHAIIGPMNSADEEGNVYGAGKGIDPQTFNKDAANYAERSRRMTIYNATDFPDNAKLTAAGYTGNGTKWEFAESYSNAEIADNNKLKFVWEYYQTIDAYTKYLETLALATHPDVTIDGNATVNGSVFGGGEQGITKGSVVVKINDGTIVKDVYGGGALANTNTTSSIGRLNEDGSAVTVNGQIQLDEDIHPTTTVTLHGGVIGKSVYGGGLGQLHKDAVEAHGTVGDPDYVAAQAEVPAIEAKVYGTVEVTLNGVKPAASDGNSGDGEGSGNGEGNGNGEGTGDTGGGSNTKTYYDCVVKGMIFGCNNRNGSPQRSVTVHVFNTQDWEGHGKTPTEKLTSPTESDHTYNVAAVYGGGNLAAFKPDLEATADTAKTYVIIDGCDLTSIKQVYGGGNAASVPATDVTVNGTYEIDEVFGGGNGADPYTIDGDSYENPGANVGYDSYAYHKNEKNAQGQYIVAEYGPSDGSGKDASTKETRLANYQYGTGETHVNIYGGTVHAVYGGSNSKGNVRVASVALLDAEMVAEGTPGYCEFNVDEAYGGGKNADMDGTATLIMSCIQGMKEAYGGAKDADVNSDVVLNITNGTFNQVFGGNNVGGRIDGSITVNIEETGCKPVIIGELYGGGNNACYSVYGYKDTGRKDSYGKTVWDPLMASDTGAHITPFASPVVNVKSFTAIGNIFGGGYGKAAVMVADPTVKIDVVKGRWSGTDTSNRFFTKWGYTYVDDLNCYKIRFGEGADAYDVLVPAKDYPIVNNTATVNDAIGAIYNVFGGGNAAGVIGTPHVNVGTRTGEVIPLMTKPLEDSEGRDPSETDWSPTYQLATAEGIKIIGDVFGGGNAAEVDGDTKVVVGRNKDVKTYSFTSYDGANGDAWSSGLAQTTGATATISDKKYSEVVILTNGKYGSFVGKKFYVDSDVTPGGSSRTQLYDADKNATSLYVAIKEFELKKDKSAISGIDQIKERNYPQKVAEYTGDILLVGINYDTDTKQHTCDIERWTKA